MKVQSQFIEMFENCRRTSFKDWVTISKTSINPQPGTMYTLYSFPAYDNHQEPEVTDGGEIKSSKVVLKENVVLYNKLNVRLSRVWNIEKLNTQNNICSSEFLPIKSKDNSIMTQQFIYQLLKSDYVTKKMVACSTGTSNSQKRITPSSLMDLEVPIPSIDLQQQFVSIAEQADKSKFVGFKSQFIEMFGTVEDNRYNYPMITIGQMVETINYGTSKPAQDGGQYGYLRMNNITYDGKLDLSDLKYINLSPEDDIKYFVQKGDLLFNRTNTKKFVGKTTVFDRNEKMVVAGYIIKVVLKPNYMPQYVAGYLNSHYGKALLKKMAKGAVHQANINAQEFQSIKILDVPIESQKQYLTILQQADKSKFELNKSIEAIDAVIKSLINN